MFYITGDTHADYKRFNTKNFPEQRDMSKSDYILVLGDFGIWDNSKREHWNWEWFDTRNFTLLFFPGNHDNYDILDSLETITWNGGSASLIRPGLIYLHRGQVYNIDGKKIFVFGGAESRDIKDGILERSDINFKIRKKRLDVAPYFEYRINHESWWERELPTEEEKNTGLKNLNGANWKVDYIFSHCAPTKIQNIMSSEHNLYPTNILTDYFNEIADKCFFKEWYFGHYHKNLYGIKLEANSNEGTFNCLYDKIIKLF